MQKSVLFIHQTQHESATWFLCTLSISTSGCDLRIQRECKNIISGCFFFSKSHHSLFRCDLIEIVFTLAPLLEIYRQIQQNYKQHFRKLQYYFVLGLLSKFSSKLLMLRSSYLFNHWLVVRLPCCTVMRPLFKHIMDWSAWQDIPFDNCVNICYSTFYKWK